MKEISRHRRVSNLLQFKKYVDNAILQGATHIEVDAWGSFDSNPYITFSAELTEEEELDLKIKKLKDDFNKSLETLKSTSFKTHFIRIKEYGLCGKDKCDIVDKYIAENKIKNETRWSEKKIITKEYDDFEEGMSTIFLVEIIKNEG